MRKAAFARGVADMNANDRKKIAGREFYRQFVEEWVFAWEKGDVGEEELTREMVLEEALDRFGLRLEMERMLGEWCVERQALNVKLWRNMEKKEKAAREGEYADAWIRNLGLPP